MFYCTNIVYLSYNKELVFITVNKFKKPISNLVFNFYFFNIQN